MSTLDFLTKKFNLNLKQKSPISIPKVGRNQLAELFGELNFKVGVEVGVAAGEYSLVLLEANPGLRLYGIDPWTPARDYKDYTKASTFARLQTEAETRLRPHPNYTHIKKFSMEAVKDFQDGSIDFVYIDGNHNFQNVTNDIVEWSKKVKPGGIISGDDYFKTKNNPNIHVVQVLQGYTEAYRINPWFVLSKPRDNEELNGDKPLSWLWVKQ